MAIYRCSDPRAGPITFQDDGAGHNRILGNRRWPGEHLLRSSDGAVAARLVALRRPDLIDRLVLVAGPFHFNGWHARVIDPNNNPPEFLAQRYAEVSPDGRITIRSS
jgi:pimeloyl-ACP methyl ester carboxylesterase